MPRQVRIEYEGAFYHVMARGNRRNRIFASPDGADEDLFLHTLGDCCARTGFRVWAWVLMRNHYHLLLETPGANLVEGMGWLQNSYTRRFNARHREWGRLFGDRDKSVLVETGGSGGGNRGQGTNKQFDNPATGGDRPPMPRQVRIEYEGAFYHVMARGNRRNRIFASPDGADEDLFLHTLGDCCARTGFRVWAWVLMRNHYHLLLETPGANLVEGMGWLQNSYTRRFNARHREWGRLFGDRYKSVLVETGGSGGDLYLRTLIDYIHLNPVRAGLVPSKAYGALPDYPWSSLAKGYTIGPKARVPWLAVEEGLALFQCDDRAVDRRRFLERLEARMKAEAREKCGLSEVEGQTLQSTLRKGWYWGRESFKETLLDRLAREKGGALPVAKDFRSSAQAKDHSIRDAESIIGGAVRHFAMAGGRKEDFAALPRGDWRRVAVAWALARKTSLKQSWIAERLSMRSAGNVSKQVRQFSQRADKELSNEIRRWRVLQS